MVLMITASLRLLALRASCCNMISNLLLYYVSRVILSTSSYTFRVTYNLQTTDGKQENQSITSDPIQLGKN